MKERSLFDTLVESSRQRLSSLPDKRTGRNTRYGMEDTALSAFGVFFTQTPSFLADQRKMVDRKGNSKAHSLFGMHQIPSDNQIRNLLDGVAPESVFPVFEEILQVLDDEQSQLDGFRSVSDTLLVAMDGTEYFSSTQICCPQCSTRILRSGNTHSFHGVVCPGQTMTGQTQVISLVPPFARPQDVHDEQDGENTTAKRWLAHHGERLSHLKVTVLGDDLYCHQPLCQQMLDHQLDFILVCRPNSHPTVYDHLEGIDLLTVIVNRWAGEVDETWTYRYLNGVPLRDGEDALLVNWCEVTHYTITDETVAEMVQAGKTRWKVENENNNILKTKDYHLEHNFGHGQQHLSSRLTTLNILSFLFHTVLDLLDQKYKRLRAHLPTRKTFFEDLRALTRYMYFDRWDHLFTFMLQGLELEISPSSS